MESEPGVVDVGGDDDGGVLSRESDSVRVTAEDGMDELIEFHRLFESLVIRQQVGLPYGEALNGTSRVWANPRDSGGNSYRRVSTRLDASGA